MSGRPVNEAVVPFWQLQDLEETIADAVPEELPELHSKLLALSTGLYEAITSYAKQREQALLKQCKLLEGSGYDWFVEEALWYLAETGRKTVPADFITSRQRSSDDTKERWYPESEVGRRTKQRELALLERLEDAGRGKAIPDTKEGWESFAKSLIAAIQREREAL